MVVGALMLCGCAAQSQDPQQPQQPQRAERSKSKCPAFTRPDTVNRDGLTVRACTDRHGNLVCVEFGGKLRCRADDGASLIKAGDG